MARCARRRSLLVAALAIAAGAATLSGCGTQARSAATPMTVLDAQVPTRLAGASAQGGAQGGPSGVKGGALFGANYPLVKEESKFGRKLAIVRLYYFIGNTFPGQAKYAHLMAGGRTVLASMDSYKHSYSAIAAGQEDGPILSFLKSMNRSAVKYHLGAIYVSFIHEPDSMHHRYLGAPAQFVQAWDHVHHLAAAAHLDWNDGGRLHWVLILIHNTYATWRVNTFWPGKHEVDLLAADGYNSAGCGSAHGQHGQQTPADTFGPLLRFSAAHGGIPVFAAEWGSDNIPPGEQATYINQMHAYVAKHHSIAGAMYWDTHVGHCDYKVGGNPSSMSALRKMGKSAALQGHTVGG